MKRTTIFLSALAAVAVAAAGCGHGDGRREPSAVTVTGMGTVSVEPDMVRLSVSMSKTERTTRLAQQAVNAMMGRTLEVLKSAGIEDKDVTTTSLTFNPEYEWRVNGRNVLVGQRAEQRVDFAVRGIGAEGERLAGIIDRLTEIDGIMLGGIDFGVEENTAHFVRSRELAFEKARQKAEQYARLSGLRVGRVLSLSEDGAGGSAPLYRSAAVNQFMLEEASFARQADAATALPSGRLEVTTRVSVVFALE